MPEGAEEKAERVIFLHGGGYSWYSPSDVYRPFTTRLAAACGLPVLAIDYRLAPWHGQTCPGSQQPARPSNGRERP